MVKSLTVSTDFAKKCQFYLPESKLFNLLELCKECGYTNEAKSVGLVFAIAIQMNEFNYWIYIPPVKPDTQCQECIL